MRTPRLSSWSFPSLKQAGNQPVSAALSLQLPLPRRVVEAQGKGLDHGVIKKDCRRIRQRLGRSSNTAQKSTQDPGFELCIREMRSFLGNCICNFRAIAQIPTKPQRRSFENGAKHSWSARIRVPDRPNWIDAGSALAHQSTVLPRHLHWNRSSSVLACT